MTTGGMTTETPTTTSTSNANPGAPARRAPGDLPLGFADEATLRSIAASTGEPAWVTDDRLAALRAFDALPPESNMLYTPYIDLRAAKLESVRPMEVAAKLADAGSIAIPEGTCGVVEVSGEGITALALGDEARQAGLRIETLADALRGDADRLRPFIDGAPLLPSDDRFAQLVRAFWSSGILVTLPAGGKIEHPLLVRWRTGEPGRAMLTRTLVDAGDETKLDIVEEQLAAHDDASAAQDLFHSTMELRLGHGAAVSVASIQDLGPSTVALQHRRAQLGASARMHWAVAQLGGRLVRSRIDNRLEGDAGSVEQVEIVFGSGDQLFDLTSYTRHVGTETTGNLLSKAALLDRSRSFMKGLITIEHSAKGTDSFLGEYGIHLSKKSRSVAIPSLEIDQPDCRRVAHSSSVGPIDESQVFYLQSRGLTRAEARRLIVLGFLEPVVSRVGLPEAETRLRTLLESKLERAEGMSDTGAAGAA